jgi:ubiquinone/menaquinone biosynthesis C-methylase UbiE/uncharacterized protein YbaR (Trm112 family)
MQWISILKCPFTSQDLHLLEQKQIEELNTKIAADKIWRADGEPIRVSLQQALTTTNGKYIFPIINEVIILLKDFALVDSRESIVKENLSADKQLVKDFYDSKGWFSNEEGNYEDAVIYEDLRNVSKEYLKKCHDRVSRYLNPSGKYMLDAASGALQYEDYLQYSDKYQYRVCVDFSLQALREAKRKLGPKGLCILCDITNLPFKNNVMDGFVSLNTIYHIPKDEQVTAIKELFRVLAPEGKGVVVYDWFKHSPWMNFWLLPFRGFVYIKNRFLDLVGKTFATKGAERRLYFYAHNPQYFKENLPPYKLRVWRTVSVPFMRYYIHSWLFGKKILNWLYSQEEKYPEKYGLKGEYPLLVFEKI